MDSFKLSYVYFFPVIFFPFLNIYQFRNDTDIKSWLFRNLLVSFIVILIPLFLTLSMMITKVLYKDQDKNTEYRSIGLGLLCCTFLTGSNYYQFHKFIVGTDLSIEYYRMAMMISFLIACFISSLYCCCNSFLLSAQISNFLIKRLTSQMLSHISHQRLSKSFS